MSKLIVFTYDVEKDSMECRSMEKEFIDFYAGKKVGKALERIERMIDDRGGAEGPSLYRVHREIEDIRRELKGSFQDRAVRSEREFSDKLHLEYPLGKEE